MQLNFLDIEIANILLPGMDEVGEAQQCTPKNRTDSACEKAVQYNLLGITITKILLPFKEQCNEHCFGVIKIVKFLLPGMEQYSQHSIGVIKIAKRTLGTKATNQHIAVSSSRHPVEQMLLHTIARNQHCTARSSGHPNAQFRII